MKNLNNYKDGGIPLVSKDCIIAFLTGFVGGILIIYVIIGDAW